MKLVFSTLTQNSAELSVWNPKKPAPQAKLHERKNLPIEANLHEIQKKDLQNLISKIISGLSQNKSQDEYRSRLSDWSKEELNTILNVTDLILYIEGNNIEYRTISDFSRAKEEIIDMIMSVFSKNTQIAMANYLVEYKKEPAGMPHQTTNQEVRSEEKLAELRKKLIEQHHQDKPVTFNPNDAVAFNPNEELNFDTLNFDTLNVGLKNIHVPLNANTELVLNLKIQKK